MIAAGRLKLRVRIYALAEVQQAHRDIKAEDYREDLVSYLKIEPQISAVFK